MLVQHNLAMCLLKLSREHRGMTFLGDHLDSIVDAMRYADPLCWVGYRVIPIPQRMIGHQQHPVCRCCYACIYLNGG